MSPHKGLQNYSPRGLSLWGRLISNSHLLSIDSVFPFPVSVSLPAQILFQLYILNICAPRVPFPWLYIVFILNLFLWFPDCLDLHGCSSIFGKRPLPSDHCPAQGSVLPGLLPQWFCPPRLYFPSPSCFSTTVIPICRFSSNSCWCSPCPSALLLPPLILSFSHLCPFFVPGVIISSTYPAVLPSHFQDQFQRGFSPPASQPQHPFPKLLFAHSTFPAIHPHFFPAPSSNLASSGAIFIHC